MWGPRKGSQELEGCFPEDWALLTPPGSLDPHPRGLQGMTFLPPQAHLCLGGGEGQAHVTAGPTEKGR